MWDSWRSRRLKTEITYNFSLRKWFADECFMRSANTVYTRRKSFFFFQSRVSCNFAVVGCANGSLLTVAKHSVCSSTRNMLILNISLRLHTLIEIFLASEFESKIFCSVICSIAKFWRQATNKEKYCSMKGRRRVNQNFLVCVLIHTAYRRWKKCSFSWKPLISSDLYGKFIRMFDWEYSRENVKQIFPLTRNPALNSFWFEESLKFLSQASNLNKNYLPIRISLSLELSLTLLHSLRV